MQHTIHRSIAAMPSFHRLAVTYGCEMWMFAIVSAEWNWQRQFAPNSIQLLRIIIMPIRTGVDQVWMGRCCYVTSQPVHFLYEVWIWPPQLAIYGQYICQFLYFKTNLTVLVESPNAMESERHRKRGCGHLIRYMKTVTFPMLTKRK